MAVYTTVTITPDAPKDPEAGKPHGYYVGDYGPRTRRPARRSSGNDLGIDLAEAAELKARADARINGDWSK